MQAVLPVSFPRSPSSGLCIAKRNPEIIMIIIEIIFEMLFQLLLVIPGAFVRWIFGGFRRRFKDILINKSIESNAFIGVTTLVLILLLVYWIRN